MAKHIGKQSILFEKNISIKETSSIVGKKEAEGPLSDFFDIVVEDSMFGQDSWEKAESEFVNTNVKNLIEKAHLSNDKIDYIVTGDLLNQCCGSTFGVKNFNIPLFSIFGACSTMGEALSLGAILIESGGANNIIAGASSHFCSAEKQFRFPIGLGNQRPQTSTWTVTGHGGVILSNSNDGPYIKGITTGKIVDYGITDANNMGAAMAPAAADLILNNLQDLNIQPTYYDLIITGDLGYVGSDLLKKLLKKEGYDINNQHIDCGIEIYDKETQDTHSGGSGCACSAVIFCSKIFRQLKNKEVNRLLFIPTGALMSPTSEVNFMDYIKAFLVGGIICVIGQVLIDKTKLTSARILVLFVVLGCILGGIGIYPKIVDFAGAGATIPLLGFGNNLAKGVINEVNNVGFIGIFSGGIKSAATGITASIAFAFIMALIFNPKEK